MNQPTWLALRFPREVTTAQALAALLALNGLSTPRRRDILILQATGTANGVVHHLRVPTEREPGATRQLQTTMPGLLVDRETGRPHLPVARAWRAWQNTPTCSLSTDQSEAIAHGLLTALAAAENQETIVLQWLLRPVRRHPVRTDVFDPGRPGKERAPPG